MGEYYNWVNVDKREYICPDNFDCGNKLFESRWPDSDCLRALRQLLSEDWAGDHVLFMGDETPISENTDNETLKIIYGHTLEIGYPGEAFEAIIELYRNISCLFKTAEAEVRPEIEFYLDSLQNESTAMPNEYGIDIANPYDGLFQKDGRSFRFIVNHSKKVFYSPKSIIIRFLNSQEEHNDIDPLPFLMSYGRGAGSGMWLGDIVGVADEIPAGYTPLEEVCFDL